MVLYFPLDSKTIFTSLWLDIKTVLPSLDLDELHSLIQIDFFSNRQSVMYTLILQYRAPITCINTFLSSHHYSQTPNRDPISYNLFFL